MLAKIGGSVSIGRDLCITALHGKIGDFFVDFSESACRLVSFFRGDPEWVGEEKQKKSTKKGQFYRANELCRGLLRKIAVTGGLASGKTTLCQFFKDSSSYVLNADDIVKGLLQPHTDLGKKVVSLLGVDVVENEAFNRGKIAEIVFCNPTLLQKLEEILHPEVRKVIEREYKKISNQEKFKLFVVEVPLLFESGLNDFFDAIILVIADQSKCRTRFAEKSGSKIEEFDLRMKRFMPENQKIEKADFVIKNNGSKQDFQNSFNAIYKQLTRD